MFSLKRNYKLWHVFDQPIGTFVSFFFGALWEFCTLSGTITRADLFVALKEFAHAFSCAYIQLWMHFGSLESTQKARVALGCASSYSYAFFVLSKLPACIHNSIIRTLSMHKFLISVRHCFFNFIYQEIVCKGFIEFLVVLATHWR